MTRERGLTVGHVTIFRWFYAGAAFGEDALEQVGAGFLGFARACTGGAPVGGEFAGDGGHEQSKGGAEAAMLPAANPLTKFSGGESVGA